MNTKVKPTLSNLNFLLKVKASTGVLLPLFKVGVAFCIRYVSYTAYILDVTYTIRIKLSKLDLRWPKLT